MKNKSKTNFIATSETPDESIRNEKDRWDDYNRIRSHEIRTSRLDTKHQLIRKIIGGTKSAQQMSPKKTRYSDCRTEIKNISKLIPGYLQQYNLKPSDLIKPTIGKIKTTKHIITFANRSNIPIKNKNELTAAVGRLGEKVSCQDTTKYKVEILTDPSAFVRLTQYGLDNNTCFNDPDRRIRIMNKGNSFVGLISKNDIIICRCWGWVSRPKGIGKLVINTCNYYCRNISKIKAQNLMLDYLQLLLRKNQTKAKCVRGFNNAVLKNNYLNEKSHAFIAIGYNKSTDVPRQYT